METVATGVRELGAGETVLHTGRPSMTRPKVKVDEDSDVENKVTKQQNASLKDLYAGLVAIYKPFAVPLVIVKGKGLLYISWMITLGKTSNHQIMTNRSIPVTNKFSEGQTNTNNSKVNGKPIRMEVDTGTGVCSIRSHLSSILEEFAIDQN